MPMPCQSEALHCLLNAWNCLPSKIIARLDLGDDEDGDAADAHAPGQSSPIVTLPSHLLAERLGD